MTVQELLEAIAALPPAERQDLLVRLRALYPPVPPRQMGLDLDNPDWDGPADCLLVFDGGSQGNPGAGYGSYAVFKDGRPGQVYRLTFAETMTNNEAEYQTLLGGLRHVLAELGSGAARASLEVRGDSLLVIQQVLGHWKAKDERMRGLRDDVRRLLARFGRYRLVAQPREDSVKVLGH